MMIAFDYDPTKPLYHGSRTEIPEGEILKVNSLRKIAYATRSKAIAKKFAERDGSPGFVYRVEPVSTDPEHVWEQPMKHAPASVTEVVSNKGFRVLGRVRFNEPVKCSHCPHELTESGAFTQPHLGRRNASWRSGRMMTNPHTGELFEVIEYGKRKKAANE